MNNGEICFSVCYIQGFVTKQTFVKLSCPTIQTPSNKTIEYQGCILNLAPCSYTLSATDIDAVDSIDTMPATSFEGIIIIVSATGHGCPYSNASTLLKTITVMPTTTVILRGTDRSCFFVLWLINVYFLVWQIIISPTGFTSKDISPAAVVLLVISGVVLMTTITLNIIISLLCVRYQRRTVLQTSKCQNGIGFVISYITPNDNWSFRIINPIKCHKIIQQIMRMHRYQRWWTWRGVLHIV